MANALEEIINDTKIRNEYLGYLVNFVRLFSNVYTYQQILFEKIIYDVKDTPYGKEMKYGPNLKLEDLKDENKFPILTNDYLFPFMEKILQGDKEVKKHFTNEEIVGLTSSSGTTSDKHKYFIFSDGSVKRNRKKGVFWYLLNLIDALKMLKGKTLFYGAIPYKDRSTAIPDLNISGIEAITAPGFIIEAQSIPPNVWVMENPEERNFEIAYYSVLNKNTLHLAFPSARVAINHWENINQNIRRIITKLRIENNNERANELEELINKEGKIKIDDLFPNIYRVSTILSDINIHDLNELKKEFRNPNKIKFVEAGVNLSEGKGTHGIPGKRNPGIPAAEEYIYVYCEFKNGEIEYSKRFFVHELEKGKQYAKLIFSHTAPFLWNTDDIYEKGKDFTLIDIFKGYSPILDKIIEKTSSISKFLFGSMPILYHITKNKYINIAQGHVPFQALEDIIKETSQKFEIPFINYFVKPSQTENNKTSYDLLIEFTDINENNIHLYSDKLKKFVDEVEFQLLGVKTYHEIRDTSFQGVCDPLQIHVLKPGSIGKYTEIMASENPHYKHKHVHDTNYNFHDNFNLISSTIISRDKN